MIYKQPSPAIIDDDFASVFGTSQLIPFCGVYAKVLNRNAYYAIMIILFINYFKFLDTTIRRICDSFP